MKYIGIDYGSKRIGIAVGTDIDNMAFPREVVPNTKRAQEYIAQFIEKEGIGAVLLGYSADLDGTDNPIQKRINAFKVYIEETLHLPVYFEPEFFSSIQATHIQGKNDMVDASAAAIILQSFLDKKANR